MKSKVLQWTAILLILITGYLHYVTAAEEYSEARYMGVLFLLNFFGSLVAAIGIFRGKLWWGWGLGIFITAGSILAYIQSRTVGMPGMEVEEWYDPIGISAILVEGLFIVVFVLLKPWADSIAPKIPLLSVNRSDRAPIYVTFAMLAMIAVGYFYNTRFGAQRNMNEHPLPETVISAQTLKDEYGIEMYLVAVTAAGGMVDVRYRVIDPVKAEKLVDPQDGGIMPMVYVRDGDTMLMPAMHMRTQRLIADRMYFVLIPNSQNAVKRGVAVTISFGDVALEPMIVK